MKFQAAKRQQVTASSYPAQDECAYLSYTVLHIISLARG